MYDKHLEKLGELTAQKHLEERAITNANIERALESVAVDIATSRQEIDKKFDQLEASFDTSLRDISQAQTDNHLEEIKHLTEQLKSQEVFEAMLTTRLAEIKDGEKGEKGEAGISGEDGLDRPLIEPVELKSDKDYPKNTLGTHKGGLWISTKQTVGDPDDDPHSWSCILDAMTTMSIDLQEDKTFKLSVRMATGKEIDTDFKIPYPEHMGIWEQREYQKGQMVTKGHSMWMALEDTNGEPPGNGWQQILSAPRGKTGAAGKSITGPQGKPGRNGRDAVLPEGFVENILSLANKAFEDGRSEAEAITSFRGYFLSGESYNRGDVVNLDGSLYLCTAGGSFESIAQSGSSFELMMGVPKVVMPAYMLWQGDWVQKTYNGGSVVRDNGWTMVATTQTTERAAPQPVGLPQWLSELGDSPAWGAPKQSSPTSEILYGQQYQIGVTGYFNSVRLYVDEADPNISYAVAIVANPADAEANIDFLLPETSFEATGWFEIPVTQTLVLKDSVFDMAVRKYDRSDSTSATWPYNYTTPNNSRTPFSGEILHANQALQELRVSREDNNGADRSATLAGITPGDRISGAGIVWSVIDATDNGSYYTFEVSPAVQGTDGVGDFVFTEFTDQPINYVSIVDHYSANAGITGFYSEDGPSASMPDQNCYGIDIEVQEAYLPNDWDVVTPGSGGGASFASAFNATERAWVAESATPLKYGSGVTSDNAWTEIGRVKIDDGTSIKFTVSVDAKRTDQIDYHVSEWRILAFNNGGITDYIQKDLELGVDLSVRTAADGDEIALEVRGKQNQTWEWHATSFARELI